MSEHIAAPFQKNRAELLPNDVLSEFIIPTYYDSLEPVLSNHRPILVTGGRGCGKTIFLRFLSHQTSLSTKRKDFDPKSLELITMYWKPDIGFLGMISQEWLGDSYRRVFEHYVTVSLLLEFSYFIESLIKRYANGEILFTNERSLPLSIKPYLPENIITYADIKLFANQELARLDVWTGNPNAEPPKLLRSKGLLTSLVNDLRSSNLYLEKLCLRIFIDEYERLAEYQRIILNDYVRDSSKDLIFCFALRKHCIDTFPLSRDGEFLREKHDFDSIDIEEKLSGDGHERNFEILAAEMLLLKLHKNSSIRLETALFKVSNLFSTSYLETRKQKKYQDEILGICKRILPQVDAAQIASTVFTDPAFRNRWSRAIETGIKQHNNSSSYKVDHFELINDPVSSLVAACVLNRRKPSISEIKDEFDKIDPQNSSFSRFTKSGGWNENTLHGALWYLYQGLPDRDCLLYSGFSRFYQMSSPNMRYFQELCKVAFTLFEENRGETDTLLIDGVPPNLQARAAKLASTELLEDVAKGGQLSQQLSRLIGRLGHVFAAAHKRRSQSEVEINHFSISNDTNEQMPPEIAAILRYGLMESVLYAENDTKNKSQTDVMTKDYIPNRIFAPYFRISYRKKKKLILNASKLKILATGNDEEYKKLLNEYINSWDISEELPSQLGLI
jgi:hypothetical protein